MLVDTGSDVTLISLDNFAKFKPNTFVLGKISTNLTTADGDPLNVAGIATIPLCIEKHFVYHSVVVADLGELDGILGMDFLTKNEVSFDISKGLLMSPNFQVQMHRDKNKREICARVHLSHTVHIPPKSEIYVEGEIRGHLPNIKQGCLEPLDQFRGSKDLLMPKSIVNLSTENVIFSIMNPTHEPKIIKQNVQVASVQPIECVIECDPDSLPKRVDTRQKQIMLPEHLQQLVDKSSQKLTHTERDRLASVIADYADVFVGPDGKLGHTDLVQHEIETSDSRPIKLPLRRLPITQRETAEIEIDKMLEQGIIEPSYSPWAAPIVLVKKRDGSTRFCVDYRRLNSITKKDAYPLPRIDESLDALAGAKYFCSADMASSFWQVDVAEKDRPKTAFITHKGLFQWCKMPFGLANSPKTFERLMELVLSGLHWDRCLVYIDDLIVYGKTFTETLNNLVAVFERLRTANLKLKPKKCVFFQDEIRYLGHIVSENGIKCDPDKIESIVNWPTPQNVSEVRSLLGIASYYRKFIPAFSELTFPINRLTRKNCKFDWTDECEAAFRKLKLVLTSPPILSYPTPTDKFILDTDASLYGIGAVLSQVQNGEERVIAYGSKTLSRSQSKYCTTYRELLAVVTFVKQFRHYLYGRNFLIRTDHSSLIWLKNFKEPEGMLARWISLLDTYDYDISHRRGTAHGNADALSRRPCRSCKRTDCPQCFNSNKIVAPINNMVHENSRKSSTADSNWLQQWSQTELTNFQQDDESIKTISKHLLGSNSKPEIHTPNQDLVALLRQWDLLKIVNGLLFRELHDNNGSISLQLVAPKPIRFQIMQQLHNSRTAGHLGREKTLSKVRSRFYWPGMSTDIARWCQTCIVCARAKSGPGIGKSPMHHYTVSKPMECIAIDIMGPLPETDNGNQYIMIIGDYFSRWKEAYAIPNHTAITVADKLTTEFICRFGVPTRIHTDQGREFESGLFSEVCKLLGVNKSRTTPYHPQSDGMVERYNQTVQVMLSMYVDENRSDWDDHLPYVMMAYRASKHESTKCSPNLLMLGREVQLPIDLIMGTPPDTDSNVICTCEYVEWVKSALERAYQYAFENMQSSFQSQKRYYDTKLKFRKFYDDQLVWCWYPPLAKQKLGLGWTGPYRIVRKISDITYQITSCETGKIKTVHVDHLKPVEGNGRENEFLNVTPLGNSPTSTVIDLDDNNNEDSPKSPPTPELKYTKKGRLVKPRILYSP